MLLTPLPQTTQALAFYMDVEVELKHAETKVECKDLQVGVRAGGRPASGPQVWAARWACPFEGPVGKADCKVWGGGGSL